MPSNPRTCASCLVGRRDLEVQGQALEFWDQEGWQGEQAQVKEGKQGEQASEYGLLESCMSERDAEGLVVQALANKAETLAQELLKNQDYNHKKCEELLKDLPFRDHTKHRQAHQQARPRYPVLGAYAYGNHYGVTKMTRQLPKTCRYLLQYLQHWSSEPIRCSSLVVNDDCRMGAHRDVNNLPNTKNYVIGVTSFQQGELWLEGQSVNPKDPTHSLKLPTGEYKSGHLRQTRHQVVTFDARKWHANRGWQGHRVTLGGYTSRGVRHLSEDQGRELRACGFQWGANEGSEQAQVVFRKEAKKGTKVEKEIKRKLYLLHAATGHGSTKNLVEALKRRNVNPLVLRLAEEFQCPYVKNASGPSQDSWPPWSPCRPSSTRSPRI